MLCWEFVKGPTNARARAARNFSSTYVYLRTYTMDQTGHKLVVNPEQLGGIIAVGAKSLQFIVTTEAQRQGDEGVIQLDLKSPGARNPRDTKFSLPTRRSPPSRRLPPSRHSPPSRHLPPSGRLPASRQWFYTSNMYSSDEGSPPPGYHGSPSFDVSGLANPNKCAATSVSMSPLPPPHLSDAPGHDPSLNPARPRLRHLEHQRSNRPGFTSIQEEKLYILLTLKRMRAEGVDKILDFSADSDIEEMRLELKMLQEDLMVINGIENCRTALITFTTGTEILNKKYDPFDLDLDGWSQRILESIKRYDGVLEKLTRKYVKCVSAISPKIQLLLMLCGSAASFCFTKSMMKGAQPTMIRIAEENPELIQKMMQGMAQQEMRGQGMQGGASAETHVAVPVVPAATAVPLVPAVPVDIFAPKSSRYEVPEAFVRPHPQGPPREGEREAHGDGDDDINVSLSIADDMISG
jgi:hypothetical protein